MGLEVANCLHRPPLQTSIPSASSSQLDHKKRVPSSLKGGAAFGVNPLPGIQSSFLSTGRRGGPRFNRTRSFEDSKRPENRLRRACSARLGDTNNDDINSDDEYLQRLRELALQCHLDDEIEEEGGAAVLHPATDHSEEGFVEFSSRSFGGESSSFRNETNPRFGGNSNSRFAHSRPFPSVKLDTNFSWPEPDWNAESMKVNRISPVSLEKKADGVGLPLSLRILKRKQNKERGIDLKPGGEGFRDSLKEVGESACCSVRKAFSSMVFMIRELQNYTLQMRQILCYGDLQELVSSVQKEMHATFVWLFQQVFSCTPTLMVSVMILLANFTVYSMGNNVALATVPPSVGSPVVMVSIMEDMNGTKAALSDNFGGENPSSTQMPSSSSHFGDLSAESQRLMDMGDGAGGSGGRNSAIAGGMDGGDAHFDGASQNRAMFSEDKSLNRGVSSIGNPSSHGSRVEDSAPVADHVAKEVKQWEAFLKEASEELESGTEEEAIDHETMQRLVAPFTVQLEPDNYACYDQTNLHYQNAISADPENALLLSNYAQFLHLVTQDYDRAEEYFQKAVKFDASDAEVISRYAHFLWLARGDLTAAEEAFLDAIAADPGNPFHAGSYAHFLWNTGGEDTCYPIS
ncbi:uncharacterized protein LOC131064745 [Cryptomeria japonica]|uniref:uncharacterized protein LOC131064745 n=1 Tax=Cryptomeria japonica TaxID=3369 RepID=UPI0027DA4885|nr:uncharacterized protein LOC131064745 [Cryptomeria japonica]XP_057855000.2 uncharacterized protein LOC131064745 [Cryptomeria japonica]